MSTKDRREYLTATTLDQGLLDRCQDNLDNGLEMVVEIQSPTGLIYASDRNKYVGSRFYEALTEFPVIKRSLGEWLAPTIEFSNLQLGLSNVDGRFNEFNPGGASFGGWINKEVQVKMGLRDVESSYTTIYAGNVTDIGGYQRDRMRVTLISRDAFDKVNVQFPTKVFTAASFPNIDPALIGVVLPVIYGDWTTELKRQKLVPSDPSSPVDDIPIVPAFPVNGGAAGVIAGTTSVRLYVSDHDLTFIDDGELHLKRGDAYYKFDAADVSIVSGNRVLDVKQIGNGGTTLVDGAGYQYAAGDTFFVPVKGKNLGAYDDNPVWQARDILMTFGGLVSGDFDANWETYRDKASPAESAVSTFKSRIWVQEPQGVMEYALSLLEQVRLEAFVSRERKFKINSLHLDDFVAAPSYAVRNWDIEAGTFNPKLDDRNAWNRARASYSFDPSQNAEARETPIYRNSAAITQSGKEISKRLIFPNLYQANAVILQTKEMLKLASGYAEFIEMTLTPRAALKELGDFVSVNVTMGATVLENVPAMIRDIGYDPAGLRIPVRVWSFQMIDFPGYSPGYAGMVGGAGAVITEE